MVAARRRGLTPVPWLRAAWCCGWGVLAPVATGVEKFDGSSDVNMVALDGDIRYRELRAASSASLNPARFQLSF